jgi:hypothetical protein
MEKKIKNDPNYQKKVYTEVLNNWIDDLSEGWKNSFDLDELTQKFTSYMEKELDKQVELDDEMEM